MKSVYFFATSRDMSEALGLFEKEIPLQYVETETRRSRERATFLGAGSIPNLGIATHETGSLSAGYLVSLRGHEPVSRMSTARSGAQCWTLYNGDNPGTMTLTPAGHWKEMLLAGNAGTVHDDPEAQRLIRRFQSALKAEGFAKAGRFWVGREALHMLESGRRLSFTAEQSPAELDLRLEHVVRPPRSSLKP